MDLKRLALHRSSRRRKKGDTAKLAAQLAPLEELSRVPGRQVGIESPSGNGQAQANQDSGAIIVDKDLSLVGKEMMEGGDETTFLGMEPVVLVILGVMLLFIAFVAWQITQMPAK
jgi:hypothetical protein